MQDERENNIEYNEGWQEISTPQFRDDFLHNYEYENENKSEDNTNREELNDKLVKPRKSASNEPKQTLILFQLIICAFIALCAIALKQFGGDIYNIAHSWYDNQLNSSIIVTDKIKQFDFNDFQNSTTPVNPTHKGG